MEKKNYKKAEEIYTGYKEGYKPGICYLGIMYFFGHYYEKDYQKAFDNLSCYYPSLKERFFFLGMIYEYGLGKEINIDQAREHYETFFNFKSIILFLRVLKILESEVDNIYCMLKLKELYKMLVNFDEVLYKQKFENFLKKFDSFKGYFSHDKQIMKEYNLKESGPDLNIFIK